MNVNESSENYLEAILKLSMKLEKVKSIDVAKELNFSKASVSVAMKNLRSNNFISIDYDGYITLTKSGLKIANTIYERHIFLFKWLTHLGVNAETASSDACRIEHVISEESFNALKKHIDMRKAEKDQNNIP